MDKAQKKEAGHLLNELRKAYALGYDDLAEIASTPENKIFGKTVSGIVHNKTGYEYSGRTILQIAGFFGFESFDDLKTRGAAETQRVRKETQQYRLDFGTALKAELEHSGGSIQGLARKSGYDAKVVKRELNAIPRKRIYLRSLAQELAVAAGYDSPDAVIRGKPIGEPEEPIDAKQLGRALMRLCRLKGWENNDVKTETGLARKIVTNMFAGLYSPNSGRVKKMLDVLGIPSARTALEEAARREAEYEYCRHFSEIIEVYRQRKDLAPQEMGRRLWPEEQKSSSIYCDLRSKRELCKVSTVSPLLARLGMSIHQLISEAALEHKYPDPVVAKTVLVGVAPILSGLLTAANSDVAKSSFTLAELARRAREKSAADKDR